MKKVAERLKIQEDRVYMNIERYGNTSSASIPVALDEANRSGRLKRGDLVLLDAFGGGFTWGAVMIRW
jgi:3-oxoacyl-[acyl-carrier-protein] synthase-3